MAADAAEAVALALGQALVLPGVVQAAGAEPAGGAAGLALAC